MLQKEVIEPNAITFTSLIDACAQLGDVERANRWFRCMGFNGIEPNVRTVSAMLNACAKSKDPASWELAVALFRDMSKKSIQPDEFTFASMLNVCANTRHKDPTNVLDMAEEVVGEMKQHSHKIKPDHFHLSSCQRLQQRHPGDERPREWVTWMIHNGADPGKVKSKNSRGKQQLRNNKKGK
mmetsp:Transcript_22161/g.54227  ORF Transcript_22161/g.54227 Transcript_22161/m.54227 type:complete len:182 (-) Transcript_22161:1215-1760(-)